MALNDPQRGKRGNEGPPDLDEVFRKLNQKLGGLFGGSGGNGPAGTPPSARGLGGGLLVVIGLLAAVWMASGFYIVEEGKRGVVLRLGKYLETTSSGPRWHWPYPVETAEIVNESQVRAIEVGYRNPRIKEPKEALMLTDDQNIVEVQFAVQYTLKSVKDYLFNNNQPDDTVRQVAETAMREIVGKSKMDYVLYEGRAEIPVRARSLMQQMLDRYETGIQISSVTMQDAQPPVSVQASFSDAVSAKQDQERAKNEGQAYANDVVPRAKGMASRLFEEANAYKARVIANAEGEASRFKQVLAEYEKAPQVTRERIYLETMQQVLGSSSKVLIDQKSSGGNLLYLPLDKIMQMPGAAPATTTGEVTVGKPQQSVDVTNAPSQDVPRSQQLRARDTR
jgi:membrane protease subunit HflK